MDETMLRQIFVVTVYFAACLNLVLIGLIAWTR
jgi:phage shock protein PspC (stress-responsive transcriptional regulator)